MNNRVFGLNRTIRFVLLVLVVCSGMILVPTRQALADIGPKPTLEFRFSYLHGQELRPVSGELLGCDDSDCQEPKSLEGNPYMSVRCEANSCSAGLALYHGPMRLRILFSDGQTRLSNPFEATSFDNVYTVKVGDQDMYITRNNYLSNNAVWGVLLAIFPLTAAGCLALAGGMVAINRALEKRNTESDLPFKAAPFDYILAWFLAAIALAGGAYFTWALPLTILIELGIAYLYYRNAHALMTRWNITNSDRVNNNDKQFIRPTLLPLLTAVACVNLITQPLLWGSAVLLGGTRGGVIYWPVLILEVVVWLAEGVLLRFTQYRHLRWTDAFRLSFFMNLASFSIGLLFSL